jgi:hypothetical protein
MKTLLFKVEHGDWSAELRLAANHDLDDLAYAILEAVGFECDHAYGFYDNLKNPYRSIEEYTLFATLGEDAKPDDPGVENTLVSTVFKPGKKMLFLFDYGDDWMFPVTCTGEAEAKPFKRPKLLSTSGEPPEQYPDWEE